MDCVKTKTARENASCFNFFEEHYGQLTVRALDSETLLNVCFQNAKNCFVPLNGHLQGGQQSLGCEEVHDHALLNVDRVLWNSDWLWIQTEVYNQFFW